jgi:hypothetical protein
MKKINITADVEFKNDLGTIQLKDDGKHLLVDISSSSAVIYPLRVYLGFRRYLHLSKYLNQKIMVMISNKNVIAINNGQISYLKKWWLFKFILNSIIKKGI